MSATATIRARSNADWIKTFVWSEAAAEEGGANTPISLVGSTLSMQARKTSGDREIYLDLDSDAKGGIEIDTEATGKFTITISKTFLSRMVGDFDFDLVCLNSNSQIKTVMSGQILVEEGVTR